MGIFQIFFIQREVKKGINDPGVFIAEKAMDFVKIYLILSSLIGLGLILLMAVLGMTHWLGGPYGIARFFFWVFLLIFVPSELVFILLFIKVKKVLKHNLERAVLAVKNKME